MLDTLIKTLFCVFLIFTSTITYADSTTKDPEIEVTKAIQSFMRVNKVPGVMVELYIHGKPYSYHFGYANLSTGKRVTDYSIFDIGSVTKVFTGLLLALEVDAGKMSLNDPITKYLPHISNAGKSIQHVSLLNLATHTAGFSFYTPRKIKNENILINYLAHWRPTSVVGSHWHYSNFGIGLLGAAIEESTHASYNELYRSRILIPLQMNPIAFVIPLHLRSQEAQGYDGAGVRKSDSKLDIFPGSWGLKASGHDMLNFLAASIGLPGTPPNILAAMRLSQTPFMRTDAMLQGLGWQIRHITAATYPRLLRGIGASGNLKATLVPISNRHFDPNALIDKTGAWDGFRTYIAVLPSRNSGIVIMANRSVANRVIVSMARKLLFNLADVKVEMRKLKK
ncbi:MAG: serine hydrolase [Gammaproteobacteria bacterium]